MVCLIIVFLLLGPARYSPAATGGPSSLASREAVETRLFESAKSDDVVVLEQLLGRSVSPNAREQQSQRTPLFYAVQRGNVQMVQLLLERGAAPNAKDSWGVTPLMIAVQLGNNARSRMVRILVQANADIDAQSIYGDTAILLAAERGFTDTVLFLAQRATRNGAQSGLNRALLRAIQSGNLDDVTELLKHGANPNAQLIGLNGSGEIVFKGDTLLIEAAKLGQKSVVTRLIQAGADPNLPGSGGRTALMSSVQQNGEVPKLLLDSGANPNLKDDFGKSALMYAVLTIPNEGSREETIQLLIKAGADVNARDHTGSSVSEFAIASGNVDALPILIENGAILDRRNMLKAAAEFASRNRFPDIAKTLLDGADLDGRDNAGLTALMRTARSGHAGLLKVLLHLGSQPNLEDKNGMTPLMYAARHRHTDSVKALLAAGADPNKKDQKGTTALIIAIPTYWVALNPDTHRWAKAGDGAHTVRALLQGGADPNTPDADGLTPLIFAAGRGQAEIVKLLLAGGADLNAKGAYGISAYHVAAGEEVVEILRQARAETCQAWQMPKTSIESINRLLVRAAFYGDVGLMEVLFKEGADPNFRGDFFGQTPLLSAVAGNKLSSVQLLLRHNADPNGTDIRNATPPLLSAAGRAAKSRDTEAALLISKVLLDAGANVNGSDTFGRTPLANACARANIELVRLLLNRRANPNLKDQAGRTPLIHFVDMAPSNAGTDIVTLLINGGADIKAMDRDGRTAIDIARSRNRADIVSLLLKTPK